MSKQKHNPENTSANLATGQTVAVNNTTSPCQEACDEILTRIKEGPGIPITINATGVGENSSNLEITKVRNFINESRIVFREYKKVMDDILNCNLGKADSHLSKTAPATNLIGSSITSDCNDGDITTDGSLLSENENNLFRTGSLFSSSKSYSILKYATEKFIHKFLGLDYRDFPSALIPLPYIQLIEDRLSDISCGTTQFKFRPLFVELIWNYWHEEGMLGHTMNAIANRFENKGTGGRNPLGNFVLDPLRPLSNLIWGYIQDKIHRLEAKRVESEIEGQYGMKMLAGSGFRINSARRNSFFIEAFHNLLHKCSIFYKEADNLFRVPDAFPILNALKEVHLLLAEAAGNQFSDLTMTARSEMMLKQYILSRSEIREFLGVRIMVPYDEPWMDKVDSLKSVMGWPGASISYYHELAEFGEKILLSVRWISWSQIDTRDLAKDWALLFRDAIQHYIHSYHAVTGVDLSAPETMGGSNEKSLMPALLIQRKLQRDAMVRRR